MPAATRAPTVQMKTSGLATASLFLGILSVVFSCLTGIPGLVCGLIGLLQIRQSKLGGATRLSGYGFATTGMVLSVVFMVLHPMLFFSLMSNGAHAYAKVSGCANNLKGIMLGVHVYADAHRHANDNLFPTDIYDNDGTPLLSWRVAILPYIEEGGLYKKFRLAEPWDSPHNIQLLGEMPALFRCPAQRNRRSAGMTSYIAVKGDGLFLDPGGKPRVFSDFADGTSRSVAIVEVPPSMEIEWTKPDPPMRDVNGFLEATSNCHGGSRFHAAFADGHVEMLDGGEFNRHTFRKLLTINGGAQIREE